MNDGRRMRRKKKTDVWTMYFDVSVCEIEREQLSMRGRGLSGPLAEKGKALCA